MIDYVAPAVPASLPWQGRVHARVSMNFAEEFGVFLSMPLHAA